MENTHELLKQNNVQQDTSRAHEASECHIPLNTHTAVTSSQPKRFRLKWITSVVVVSILLMLAVTVAVLGSSKLINGKKNKTNSGSPPKLTLSTAVADLKEGQRLIINYEIRQSTATPLKIVWKKWTGKCFTSVPSAIRIESSRLVIERATPDVAGDYVVVVSNYYGEDKKTFQINVESRRKNASKVTNPEVGSTACETFS